MASIEYIRYVMKVKMPSSKKYKYIRANHGDWGPSHVTTPDILEACRFDIDGNEYKEVMKGWDPTTKVIMVPVQVKISVTEIQSPDLPFQSDFSVEKA